MKISKALIADLRARGLCIAACRQPEHMFEKDGRRLSRCPKPTDPWHVLIYTDVPCPMLAGKFVASGIGASPTEAVVDALKDWKAVITAQPPQGFYGAIRRLENAVEELCLALSTR